MSDAALIHKRIDLGVAAENFLNSDVCRHLVTEAERTRAILVDELIDCPADDASRNTALRIKISQVDTWQFWLVGLLTDGLNAREELQQANADAGGDDPPI